MYMTRYGNLYGTLCLRTLFIFSFDYRKHCHKELRFLLSDHIRTILKTNLSFNPTGKRAKHISWHY